MRILASQVCDALVPDTTGVEVIIQGKNGREECRLGAPISDQTSTLV